ncbi:T-cell leukemia/lymphoma protein 1A [Otolemur garnettii]|uniref:T-cell leukemia/lymphoma protein 1A n=1 Tax=Otolemur garnettii TaxID=30611 RepID=UPI000C7EB616|nr:T-cell leukemia/lymphoma protein 1A [Otolemur garnettii]
MGELPPCFPVFRMHSNLLSKRKDTSFHPDRLWIWEKAVYKDENQRTWLPIAMETESGLQVLMHQEDVPLGKAMSPSELEPFLLPLMWQLYPEKRYRASDSSFWRIVYHVEFNGMEDMLLEKLPLLEWE